MNMKYIFVKPSYESPQLTTAINLFQPVKYIMFIQYKNYDSQTRIV